jgi:DNA-binding NarL/FixJ family response regulator
MFFQDLPSALVADDHPLFRSALIQALTPIFDQRIAETANLDSTIGYLQDHPGTDITFLDINMPGNEGLNGLVSCLHQFPNTLFVIVSAQESIAVMHRTIKLGAVGFIPKSASLDTIASAVEKILSGETWLPHSDAYDALTGVQDEDFAARLALLTPHQLKVLQYMSEGLLNKQIAHEMVISESTVKQHASAVLKKLNVINRTKAGVLFKHWTEVSEE